MPSNKRIRSIGVPFEGINERREGVRNLLTRRTGKEGEQRGDL